MTRGLRLRQEPERILLVCSKQSLQQYRIPTAMAFLLLSSWCMHMCDPQISLAGDEKHQALCAFFAGGSRLAMQLQGAIIS